MLLAMEITHLSSHTKNMNAQRCGGLVAYIDIGDVIMHQVVYGAVNFELQWKRKRGKKHDTHVKIESDSKDIHNKRVVV